MNKKTVSLVFRPFYCPIPEDQKTVNEYLNLKKSLKNDFFLPQFKKQLTLQNYLTFFAFYSLLVFSIKKNELNTLFFFGFSFFFVSFLAFLFILFQLIDLSKKMGQSKIFYEEGSWFNIEYWEKLFFLIKNDRLILTQKVRPILKKKIRIVISVVSSAFFLGSFIIINNSIK
jgi:hypothetical protein